MWTLDGETLDGDIGLREAEGCQKEMLDGEITNTLDEDDGNVGRGDIRHGMEMLNEERPDGDVGWGH